MVREAVSVALDSSSNREESPRVVAASVRRTGVHVPAEPWVFGGWVSALADGSSTTAQLLPTYLSVRTKPDSSANDFFS